MFLFSADGAGAFGSADLPAVSEASAAVSAVVGAFQAAEGHLAAAEPVMDFNIYNGAIS